MSKETFKEMFKRAVDNLNKKEEMTISYSKISFDELYEMADMNLYEMSIDDITKSFVLDGDSKQVLITGEWL